MRNTARSAVRQERSRPVGRQDAPGVTTSLDASPRRILLTCFLDAVGLCDRGGTGRRAGLRILWGNPWGFESLRSHDSPTRSGGFCVTAPWPILLNVALRTTIVYLALLAGLRLTGTRALGQMSTFDLVMLLIIANAVQNAMVGPDTSLAGGLVAAGVLIGWHAGFDWGRQKNPRGARR